MFIVVAYDVADDRRRTRVMKLLEGYGRHVQESVFECDVEPKAYRQLVARLLRMVNLREDNVRLYHLCPMDVRRVEAYGLGLPVEVREEYTIV